MIGTIEKNNLSTYQPSKEIRDFTGKVKKAYEVGVEILNKQYMELNNRSVIEDENRGQLMFNAFVDETVEDPKEAWKWRGTRSKARNKGIAMHANLTANYLLPLFIAQNDNDEVDRDFSEVMRDIIEWMAQPTNSNYQSSFLQIVFGMITNPVTYLGAEYCEVYQRIKEKTADGKYEIKEVLDEILSGFQAPIYSSSQILITNAFERNIQKQKSIIKRRYVDKDSLESKYGDHPFWPFVKEGQKAIYDASTELFYDIKDEDHQDLVCEEIYYNRRDDTEVPFVGGIYLGDIDNVDHNPIKHRDNRNAPKYNVIPFGYYRIGDHFFYYKSMMNALGWDNLLYDAMSEVVMNRALLEVEMPIAVSGSDKIDSDVMFPNSVVTFEDKDAKIQPLMPNSNMAAGFNALRETENSIDDGSVNPTISGQLPDASQKAYSVAQAQTNAKKIMSGVGKSLGESIVMYGDLMKDIVLNHITTPQVQELTGGKMKLKYRSFMLENKKSSGKLVDRNIILDESLIGLEMSDDEKRAEEFKMLESSGYPDSTKTIRRVNPEQIAKFKYLSKVDLEEMFPKNNDYWQPVLMQLNQMLAQDPLIDQEALRRKLLYAYFQSEGDDLIKKQAADPMQQMGAPKGSQFSQQVMNKQLSNVTQDALVQ